jgi:hypothetical protein
MIYDMMTVQQAWDMMDKHIKEAVQDSIPRGSNRQQTANRKPPWMNQKALEKIREKRRAYRKYMRTRCEEDYKIYAKFRNQVKTSCKQAIRDFEYKVALEAKGNPKAFYSYMRSKMKTKDRVADLEDNTGQLVCDDKGKAHILNQFFTSVFTKDDNSQPEFPPRAFTSEICDIHVTEAKIKRILRELKTNKSPGPDLHHPLFLKEAAEALVSPITLICQKSIDTGQLPQAWKEAHVTPIYKKGPKEKPENYRPVSLTSIVCKTMEKIVRDSIIDHLNANNFFSDYQHGFMHGRSCASNLLAVLDAWTDAIDQGMPIDVIYLDLAKAFDKVSHNKLLIKLKAYGINGNLLSWIKDFLIGRKQRVVVNGTTSPWTQVTSGVPQGSVLGPVLFVIYVNDLPETTLAIAQMFADDTKLFQIVTDNSSRRSLQDDINRLSDWAEKWQLNFNSSKCKVLHIGRTNQQFTYTMSDKAGTYHLESTTLEKDLGVHMDPELKFSQHIEKQVNKANQILGMIRRTFEYMSAEIMSKLFTSLVRPHLEFCNVVWSPLYQKDINLIEGVQRRATRMVPGLRDIEYEERLKKLKLPSLQYRRARGDMIEVYKLLRGHYTTNHNLLELHGISRTRGHNYKIKKKYARTSLRRHFFSNRVTDIWNSLPYNTVNAPSLNSFKNRLDKIWSNYKYSRTQPQPLSPQPHQDNTDSDEFHPQEDEQDQLTGQEA